MSKEKSYEIMENNLISNLRPVQPNPEFVKNLGIRLLKSDNIRLEDPNYGWAFIFVSIGLFIGALLVWILRKSDSV